MPHENVTKIIGYVAGHVAIAATKPRPREYLETPAAWVRDQYERLGKSPRPAHLEGLDLQTLQMAVEALEANRPLTLAELCLVAA